jgi:hypothetical protein
VAFPRRVRAVNRSVPTVLQTDKHEYAMLTVVVHKGLSKSKCLGKALTRTEQAAEPAPAALM